MEKIKIAAYKNQPNEKDYLYRYVTLDKLLDFLISERISLVRLNIFSDKSEGSLLEKLVEENSLRSLEDHISSNTGGINVHINGIEKNFNSEEKENFQNNNFASCWYISNSESVAMWQLYSNSDSVAIKIPYKSLIQEFSEGNLDLNPCGEKISYGSIKYHDFKSLEGKGDYRELRGFVKDSSFKHEQEFRIMAEVDDSMHPKKEYHRGIPKKELDKINKKKDLTVLYLKLNNFKKLPFEIIFHPYSQDWQQQNIIKTLAKLDLNFKYKDSDLTDFFN